MAQRVVWAALLGLALGTGMAGVQEARAAPAELPPAGFTRPVFVDSEGCVFVRAALGGTETWVPRVGPDRVPICGATPSVQRVTGTSVATTTKSMPSEAEVAAAASGASGGEAAGVGTASRARAGETPALVPLPGIAPPPGFELIWDDGRLNPNRGPRPGAQGPIVPRSERAQSGAPRGFEPVWDDGRLNPQRGPKSAAGTAAMNRIWSQTVPRRLVGSERRLLRPSETVTVEARASSKTTPKAVLSPVRYVQVGVYRDDKSLRRTLRRLKAGGLPVRTGRIERKGETLKVALAGPYSDNTGLESALRQAQALGYGDAFLR